MRRKYLEWSHQEFYHTTALWLDTDFNEQVDLDISKDQFLLRLGSTGELNLTEQGDLASKNQGGACVCVCVRAACVCACVCLYLCVFCVSVCLCVCVSVVHTLLFVQYSHTWAA